MKDRELIDSIIELYKEARVTVFSKANIKRGRNHSIASKVEDLFAVYVSELLPDDVEILIDQPFTYRNDNNTNYAIYPDIAVIKDSEIIKMFDVKMDLGWNRNFFPFCEDKQKLIDQIRSKEAKARDGVTKEGKKYRISEKIKYNVVIISNENISKTKKDENLREIDNLDKDKIEVFILTENIHPNNYDKEIVKNINLRQTDFVNLRTEIKSNAI